MMDHVLQKEEEKVGVEGDGRGMKSWRTKFSCKAPAAYSRTSK